MLDQFNTLYLGDAGDEREMVILSPPRVANLPPTADIAVLVWLGISLTFIADCNERLEAVSHPPKIGAEVRHSP
jgi:hypothetical protein